MFFAFEMILASHLTIKGLDAGETVQLGTGPLFQDLLFPLLRVGDPMFPFNMLLQGIKTACTNGTSLIGTEKGARIGFVLFAFGLVITLPYPKRNEIRGDGWSGH